MSRAARRPRWLLAPLIGMGLAGLVISAFSRGAHAEDPDPSAPGAPVPQASTDPGAPAQGAPRSPDLTASCVEYVPAGATRPEVTESFPDRGLSGYASNLEITVKHGKGETVLPDGFKVQSASDAGRALALAGFVLPDPDGGSPPSITRDDKGAAAVTKLSIPFVPLPKDPGRNEMILPSVPIAVARASGEIVTICTKPHPIRVEDPTANEPDPKVKPNAPPRPQREDWEAARRVAIGVAIGAVATLIALLVWRWWRKQPRVVKGPPPKLPWVVALEELSRIRRSSLLEDGKTDEYYDRVSDAVRKYLGARYGFDGLEATTDEMHNYLIRVRPPIANMSEIMRFLEECDLVKFARVVPTDKDCLEALTRGEAIVHMTIPRVTAKEAV